MSFDENTKHGHFGKLQAHDRIKVNLNDGTTVEGIISSFHHGGTYVGRFFMSWESIVAIAVVHRPTEEEIFQLEVCRVIQNMEWNLRDRGTMRELLPITNRVISMVRDFDAKHSDTEVTSVKAKGPFTKVAPLGSSQTATPAHQDREKERSGL